MQLTTEQCKRIVFVCLQSLSPNSKLSLSYALLVVQLTWLGERGRGREREGSGSESGCCFHVPTCEKHLCLYTFKSKLLLQKSPQSA